MSRKKIIVFGYWFNHTKYVLILITYLRIDVAIPYCFPHRNFFVPLEKIIQLKSGRLRAGSTNLSQIFSQTQ
jgi:hypothetical protein